MYEVKEDIFGGLLIFKNGFQHLSMAEHRADSGQSYEDWRTEKRAELQAMCDTLNARSGVAVGV